MDTKKYVNEISANESVCESLGVLNAYKSELLNECKDSDYITAKKTLEEAKEAYKKAANKVVLSDSLYLNLQTECVRSAVSEFSHAHNLPSFFAWFSDNNKDEQVSIIDTAQKLGSKLKALHDSFSSGSKVAKKKKETLTEMRERLAKQEAELKAQRERIAELEKAGAK